MALLEIENLTVSFKTSTGPFKAVDGVSLSCDRGEILSIVGESGSGKSVAMLALMGLLPWTATVTADVMRFDASDLMPAEVGTGTFWTGMVDWVSGEKDIDTVLQEIDSSWPTE